MKKIKITALLTLFALSSSSILLWKTIPQAQANPGPARFFCGRDRSGVPSTMVQPMNALKPPVPLIRWTSHYFTGSGYSPATRCTIVSQKFQYAYVQNPNFAFTTAVVNGEPVICAAVSRGAPCTTMLYTIKRGIEDPILRMLRLEQVKIGASGPINESTSAGNSSSGYVGVADVIASLSEVQEDMPSTSYSAPAW